MVDVAGSSIRSPLAPGFRLLLETANGPVALFEVAGTVHAIEDGCLRCGSTLLDGALEGCVVTCRTCGWQYDVARGCLVGLPVLRLATYKVRVGVG